MERGMKTFSLQ